MTLIWYKKTLMVLMAYINGMQIVRTYLFWAWIVIELQKETRLFNVYEPWVLTHPKRLAPHLVRLTKVKHLGCLAPHLAPHLVRPIKVQNLGRLVPHLVRHSVRVAIRKIGSVWVAIMKREGSKCPKY